MQTIRATSSDGGWKIVSFVWPRFFQSPSASPANSSVLPFIRNATCDVNDLEEVDALSKRFSATSKEYSPPLTVLGTISPAQVSTTANMPPGVSRHPLWLDMTWHRDHRRPAVRQVREQGKQVVVTTCHIVLYDATFSKHQRYRHLTIRKRQRESTTGAEGDCTPLQTAIFHVSTVASAASVLGLSVQLGLLYDFVEFVTMQTYYLYLYFSKLHRVQFDLLSSLWRLFLGKKKNLLRNRVDSCEYDVTQMLVGTLLFTIVFFVVATNSVYYLYFCLVRCIVLGIQTTLWCAIVFSQIIPLYSIALWVQDKFQFPADVYLRPVRLPNALSIAFPNVHQSKCFVDDDFPPTDNHDASPSTTAIPTAYFTLHPVALSFGSLFTRVSEYGSALAKHYTVGKFLRCFLLGEYIPALPFEATPMRMDESTSMSAMTSAQLIDALRACRWEKIAIIEGEPGTGKSVCAASFLLDAGNLVPTLVFAPPSESSSSSIPMLRHVQDQVPLGYLDAHPHLQVQSFAQWCQTYNDDVGIASTQKIMNYSETSAFVMQHLDAIPYSPLRSTYKSPPMLHGAIKDLLTFFRHLERHGISPQEYSYFVRGLDPSAYTMSPDVFADFAAKQTDLSASYESYRALLLQHNVNTWHGTILDTLGHVTEHPFYLHAAATSFDRVLVDDLHAMTPAMIKVREIHLLSTNRTDVPVILAALRSRGLPDVQSFEPGNMFEHAAVQSAHALLQALANPSTSSKYIFRLLQTSPWPILPTTLAALMECQLDSLLSPSSEDDAAASQALAAYFQVVGDAQRTAKSEHVPFVAPYLQLLWENGRMLMPKEDDVEAGRVLVLSIRTAEARHFSADTVVFAGMTDKAFPGRKPRESSLIATLPTVLVESSCTHATSSVTKRKEFLDTCKERLSHLMLCAKARIIIVAPLWQSPTLHPATWSSSSAAASPSKTIHKEDPKHGMYPLEHISFSQLDEYMRCPHRYYLSRVLKIEPSNAPGLVYGRSVWDRLETSHDDGGTYVVEFKSNLSDGPRNNQTLAESSLQLQLYMLAYARVYGVPPRGGALRSLETSHGLNDEGIVLYDPTDDGRILQVVVDTVQKIRRREFDAVPSFMGCAYCPFADICPSKL
ncbi:hypothetical protein DYB37_000569 [Aphanomyces astaci]|uniref:PD-(D/E)XK endonuclease-like domain-containing protein n=1 Tax=Aphanomyces astaci TaxID=112090 RepID=A0A418F0M2_APHAT|nr:hypothetical protein DYB37_000569 [Aphanomyces astaci]